MPDQHQTYFASEALESFRAVALVLPAAAGVPEPGKPSVGRPGAARAIGLIEAGASSAGCAVDVVAGGEAVLEVVGPIQRGDLLTYDEQGRGVRVTQPGQHELAMAMTQQAEGNGLIAVVLLAANVSGSAECPRS